MSQSPTGERLEVAASPTGGDSVNHLDLKMPRGAPTTNRQPRGLDRVEGERFTSGAVVGREQWGVSQCSRTRGQSSLRIYPKTFQRCAGRRLRAAVHGPSGLAAEVQMKKMACCDELPSTRVCSRVSGQQIVSCDQSPHTTFLPLFFLSPLLVSVSDSLHSFSSSAFALWRPPKK